MYDSTQKGFLYIGGDFFARVTIRHVPMVGGAPAERPYVLSLDPSTMSASLTASMANELLRSLAETLYDSDGMTMETAERVAYLAGVVIADAAPITCPSCNGSGQVGAPWDPESCSSCRGTGSVDPRDLMTRDEYEAFVADTMTEEG